jgi:glyoxylase-like metal-dependent hydrolase (beta-lactamase superfamily II)/8-oxo-dGTP pyrophosphatase MutT (NUDIX family)
MGVLGGWRAFPGGGVGPVDHELPIHGEPAVSSAASFPRYDLQEVEPDLSPTIIAAGLRELWEETGLLLIHPTPSQSPSNKTVSEPKQRAAAKDASRETPVPPLPHVASQSLPLSPIERSATDRDFADWLKRHQLSLDATRLVFAGRWITPPISSFRFDTRFFLLEWPDTESTQPAVDGRELCEGDWIPARQALKLWHDSQVFAAPPTLFMLEVLAQQGPKDGLARLVSHGDEPVHPNRRFLETRPGIIAVPLITPTLPPARETISYIVGQDQVALIDVGSPFPSEIDRLILFLETLERDFGKKLAEIWLTHHHPDHVWGLARLRERFPLPVRAHVNTARRLAQVGIRVDHFIEDGQRLKLPGDSSEGILPIHTPGHADGHLVFVNEAAGWVVAGDLVAGIGTIMIDPDEGDMADYLQSLRRVYDLRPTTLFPSHGPVIDQATTRLAQLIEHRLQRESLLENLWNKGIQQIDQLVTQAYTDVSPSLHPFAVRQAEAHLIKLTREGRIQRPE